MKGKTCFGCSSWCCCPLLSDFVALWVSLTGWVLGFDAMDKCTTNLREYAGKILMSAPVLVPDVNSLVGKLYHT
jgi:hypothetical protein